jgi:hypothetical protein
MYKPFGFRLAWAGKGAGAKCWVSLSVIRDQKSEVRD